MGRRLRFLPPGSLVEVTCRTLQGRFLLQPKPPIAALCRGVLARAARLYPVEIHAFVFLGNHYHLLLTAPDARRLAAFMNYLNSNLAREIGRAVRWRERFWGRRYQAIVVSEEPAAQISRLLYLLRQGTKEGLVRRPTDWPGAKSVECLLHGKPVRGVWIDRTLEFRAAKSGKPHDASKFRSVETLGLAPLPCWKELPARSYRKRIGQLVQYVEREAERRLRESGRAPLGRDRIERQDPHDAPNRIKKMPAPLVHAVSAEVRRAFRIAYRYFADAHRRASVRLRAEPGRRVGFEHFPEFSFPPPGPFLAPA